MNHQYYIYDLPLARLELKSLIDEVREFSVYRTISMNITVNEALNARYEIDRSNSQDGKVIVYIRGKIIGTVESIIKEDKPGQTMINLISHNKPLTLILPS